jgi:hypothetical protein
MTPEQESMVSKAITKLLNGIALLGMSFRRAGNERGVALTASLYDDAQAAEQEAWTLDRVHQFEGQSAEDWLARLDGLVARAEALIARAGSLSGESN